MRIVLAVITTAMLAWTGYWFVAAWQVERGVAGWAAERAGARIDAVDVGGFPYRFDIRLAEPRLDGPAGGIGWAAPGLRAHALAYAPNHVIVELPARQTLTLPRGPLALSTDAMRASVVVSPTPALALRRLRVQIDGIGIEGADWSLTAREARLATRQSGGPDRHDLGIAVEGLRPVSAGAPAAMPEVPARLSVDATLGFAAPLDRHFGAAGGPRLTELRLRAARADWGEMELQAEGLLEAGPDGLLSGELNVRARNWREMLEMADGLGALPDRLEGVVTRAFESLEEITDEPGTVRAPLRVDRGEIRFGPLSLGRIAPAW